MPAILTHDFFGRDALPTVSRLLGFGSQDERDAFLLGNQGPDPFFYLVIDPLTRKSNLVGNLMHAERPTSLLVSMRSACDRVDVIDRSVARAFAAGFVCHYLLDREVHPYVFATQYAICDAGVAGLDRSSGSRVHEEIERDLDEMVLYTKREETIETYRPYEQVLRASSDVLRIIGRLVFRTNLDAYGHTIDPWAYQESVRCFRLAQRLLWSPNGTVRTTLGSVERQVTGDQYSLVSAMSHRARGEKTSVFDNRSHAVWKNPFTHESRTESFWDLYENALAKVEPFEQIFFSDAFDENVAARLTRGLNFSGEPV